MAFVRGGSASIYLRELLRISCVKHKRDYAHDDCAEKTTHSTFWMLAFRQRPCLSKGMDEDSKRRRGGGSRCAQSLQLEAPVGDARGVPERDVLFVRVTGLSGVDRPQLPRRPCPRRPPQQSAIVYGRKGGHADAHILLSAIKVAHDSFFQLNALQMATIR